MIATLGFIGVCILFASAFYFNVHKAKNACIKLKNNILENEILFSQIISQINEGEIYNSKNNVIDSNVNVFLIKKTVPLITIIPLNNNVTQTILPSEYNRLIKKLGKNNPTYKANLESYSLFYKFPTPFDENILKIDYSGESIFKFWKGLD